MNLPATISTQNSMPATISMGMPSSQELVVYQTWARNAFDSQMYRGVGKESAIMMIMLAAREYGIGPAQALNGGLHIIEGKVELSARIMSALIRRAKHKLQIVESNDKLCTVFGERSDTGEDHTVTYTIEEAQGAGLVKEKSGWKKNPTDMLYARAISRLARQLFSDVVGIGYVEGEIRESRPNNEVLEAIPEAEVIDEGQLESLEHEFHEKLDPIMDPGLVSQFITEIVEHFKMSRKNVLERMLGNMPEAAKKFEIWKSKRKT